MAKVDLNQILVGLDDAGQRMVTAKSDSENAGRRETAARNSMIDLAKQAVAILSAQDRCFVREFDERWNKASEVIKTRPRKMAAE